MLHPQGSVASVSARPQPQPSFRSPCVYVSSRGPCGVASFCLLAALAACTHSRTNTNCTNDERTSAAAWAWVHWGAALGIYPNGGVLGGLPDAAASTVRTTGGPAGTAGAIGAARNAIGSGGGGFTGPARPSGKLGRPDASSRGHLPTGCARRGVASGDRGEREEDLVGQSPRARVEGGSSRRGEPRGDRGEDGGVGAGSDNARAVLLEERTTSLLARSCVLPRGTPRRPSPGEHIRGTSARRGEDPSRNSAGTVRPSRGGATDFSTGSKGLRIRQSTFRNETRYSTSNGRAAEWSASGGPAPEESSSPYPLRSPLTGWPTA
ncbi:hypothetical protein THAOC_00843, partial [Thalassiosira oceanica]